MKGYEQFEFCLMLKMPSITGEISRVAGYPKLKTKYGKDMKVSDRMLNRVKACSEGLLEPEDIRGIRKKLHLTQEAAGLMIGGGARAFQKYESGD